MTEPAPCYLHVNLQLVRGKHRLYADTMGAFAKVLQEQYGWRLVGGFSSGIGRLGHVVHLWRIPSADALERTLADVRVNQPDAAIWAAAFAECIEDEDLELMHPTSYSPAP